MKPERGAHALRSYELSYEYGATLMECGRSPSWIRATLRKSGVDAATAGLMVEELKRMRDASPGVRAPLSAALLALAAILGVAMMAGAVRFFTG